MFLTRLLSSVVLVLIALCTLILGGPLLAAVTFFIALVGYFELVRATGIHVKGKIGGLEAVGFLGIGAYYAAMYFAKSPLVLCAVAVAVFMAGLGVYVITFPKYSSVKVMENFFHFIYAPVMLSFLYLTRELQYGQFLVWLIFISSWGSDTCAYLVGMCIGRKKIFPVLSPKKSLEGCIGGVAGAGLLAAAYGYFLVESVVENQTVTLILVFICMAGSVISQIGDLAASAIKRNHDIKDYGKLIPGHGGIMDRFDSVIVTAPMIYFLAALLIQ